MFIAKGEGMSSPSEFEENNGQSEDAYRMDFGIYVIGCICCSVFGGVIGWVLRTLLVR